MALLVSSVAKKAVVVRRGDINSPVLVGECIVFGPKPRNYDFKLNKKSKSSCVNLLYLTKFKIML